MPADRPNILIFMNDQQQAFPTMPEHPCRTPNADRLASEGVLFRRHYTPTAHCCPSRASFMTGRYPSGHGIWNNVLNDMALNPDLRPGVPLWSEALREAGYSLGFSGKWHVTRSKDPGDYGWDELWVGSSGKRGETHGHTWERWREIAGRGASDPERRGRGQLLRPGWGAYTHYGTLAGSPTLTAHHDHSIVETGLAGLRRSAATSRPWCVFIGPNGPHDPYIVPERYATMYDPADVAMPESWRDDLRDRPVIYRRQQAFWRQLTADERREAVAHYWGYCTLQDDLLGMALDALEETGQADDTLVLFTSDHGDYSGAHGLWMKGIPAFDEAYHIPLIARWPAGVRNPGREVDVFTSHVDIGPTLLEVAGCAPFAEGDGASLLPFLTDGDPGPWREALFCQMNGVELYYSQRQVLTRDWKYVFNGYDWDELYDLRADPHEMRNLAPRGDQESDADARGVVREMCERMWRLAESVGDAQHNSYGTVSLAPFGPLTGMEGPDATP